MKHLVLIALFALGISTAQAGSLTIVYKNDAGATIFSPSATISNADAAKFITWCQVQYAGQPLSVTPLGCFNAWANDVFGTMKESVISSLRSSAASAASTAATPIVVTPAQ